MDLQLQPFGEINLADPFFDSLKAAYPEFSVWYAKKAAAVLAVAYVLFIKKYYHLHEEYLESLKR